MENSLIKQALIMAAGRGNRMRPLTNNLPKSMAPYNGDTLIGNSLNELHKCIEKVHITVGYKKAMLSEYLMTRGGVDTIINTEGHGNAWWIRHSLMKNVNEPVLILTTDNITKINIDFLSSEYQRLGDPVCMLVPVRPLPGICGDYISHENGKVKVLSRDIQQDTYCSGIQVANPFRIHQYVGENENFNDLWNALLQMDLLYVSDIYPNKWFSIDTLENLKKANKINQNV